MKRQNRQLEKQNGSALILVVVVTVLLAVVGVMFLMVSRASEMETGAVIQNKDLGNAVDTVVARINEVLVEDLFGNNDAIVDSDSADEAFDFPSHNSNLASVGDRDDTWLSHLEPKQDGIGPDPLDAVDDNWLWWDHITDLWNDFDVTDDQQVVLDHDTGTPNPDLWMPNNPLETLLYDQADADGDGVADSRWVQIPQLTTSRGKPVFAAVRIIDNCAMLNLNGAHCFYQDSYATGVSPFATPWYATEPDMAGAILYHDNQSGSGRYLTEINYMPFLRGHDLNGNFFEGSAGGDDWYNLMIARGMLDGGTGLPYSPKNCQAVFQQIENPISGYQFFDIADELELRNRYLVTSKVESRFEQTSVANYTLDSGNGAGGAYAALEVPRDTTNDFGSWKLRIDPAQFDKWDMAGTLRTNTDSMSPYFYRYDRRHVCTVYSYDRNIRKGLYPLLDAEFAILEGTLASQQEIDLAHKIFWPVGPVTTNIETPAIGYKYNDTLPSILYPYAGSYNNVETRRRVLHLLFAFRDYFYDKRSMTKEDAAVQAAQVVANIIDYSDDDALNSQIPGESEGPFYHVDYGQQANVDCTFITKDIIDDMITEVGTAVGVPIVFDFDFPSDEIVFGYEKQPFISEVYAKRNATTSALEGFAIELLNPYSKQIDLTRDDDSFNIDEDGWRIKVGDNIIDEVITDGINKNIPQYNIFPADPSDNSHGRYMIYWNATTQVGPLPSIIHEITQLSQMGPALGGNYEIQLLRPAPANSGYSFICVDKISSGEVEKLFGALNQSAVKRNDEGWDFVNENWEFQEEDTGTYTHTLGQKNAVTISVPDGPQIGVADDGLPLTRWHELEVLGLYGNGPESSDPNAIIQTVSSTLANLDPNTAPHFDLDPNALDPEHFPNSNDLLDYIATINRPDLGSLPGRININTAPVHVIAAAIPPLLADPGLVTTGPSGYSSLNLAQDIVAGRPYASLGELLTKVSPMKQYDTGAWATENVGSQSIQGDIEEEHWVLSNLANKFTVRSDVFTAYILVRLGEAGPQRRMIGIFDRSQVWSPSDRPKLVALHPVPDPR